MLTALGVRQMRLMINNPAKYRGLEGYDLEIVDRVALPPRVTATNLAYLRTKRDRLGHDLPSIGEALP
jgi:3,4-dihydroxy 2-butanone 4-phosphate synthase/GTP cyclohydrolase II